MIFKETKRKQCSESENKKDRILTTSKIMASLKWNAKIKRAHVKCLRTITTKCKKMLFGWCMGKSRKDPPQMHPSSQKSVTIAITSGSCSFSSFSSTCWTSSFTWANDAKPGVTVVKNALPMKGKRLWVSTGGRVFADGTLKATDFRFSEEVDGSCCIGVSEWRWCWGIVSALWWSVSVWSRLFLADELGLSLSCSNARLKKKVKG